MAHGDTGKGDYASIPITPLPKRLPTHRTGEGQAASEQCKPCGAAAIMRVPGRPEFRGKTTTP